MVNRERVVKYLEIFDTTNFKTNKEITSRLKFSLETASIYVQSKMLNGKYSWRISVALYTGDKFDFQEGLDLCNLNYENLVSNLIEEYRVTTFGPGRSFWIYFPHYRAVENSLGKTYLLLSEVVAAIGRGELMLVNNCNKG